MSAVESIGRGAHVAAWFNGRAKRVTPERVQRLRRELPEARVFTSSSFDEARAHAAQLVRHPPRLLLCGGGDGTIVTLLNLLREAGAKEFPTVGLLRLGTGNGWPIAVGARRYEKTVPLLPYLAHRPPVRRYHLIEVEGRLCHFTGVGWDATLLHDYKRNLEKREQQLLGSRFAAHVSKGVWGYLYSLFRITVPEELARHRAGRTRLRLENVGEPAQVLDSHGKPHQVTQSTLYDGPMSVAACGTEPYWGAAFKAFPKAHAVPGRLNFRVYDQHVLVGVNNMFKLWRGDELPGMHDWFVTGVRLHLSRPMPFQVGGDVVEPREVLDVRLADETVDLVDWTALSQRKS
ncbi:MAG: diacylglycerol kinase family protein [Myxococcota bacterium]